MKWITPAWISPALVLALVPASIVNGQSNSRLDDLAPGPIAELLPDNGSSSDFRPGVVNPKNLFKTPAANPLPGAPNPLPAATSNRSSLINEPVPYNQVPQIQQNMYSLEDTFTLPRTPAVSQNYLQQQPQKFSAAAETTYGKPMAEHGISQSIIQPDVATAPTTANIMAPTVAGVCACGSNELAPDNCQCDACQSRFSQAEFSDECSPCNQVVQEGVDACGPYQPCDPNGMVGDDCGCGGLNDCDSCGDFSGDDCEIVGGPDAYFQTQECGFADKGDVEHRAIKHGPIARHFKKHHQRDTDRHQVPECEGAGNQIEQSCSVGSAGDCFAGTEPRNQDGNVYQPAVANNLGDPNDTRTNTLLNVSGVFLNRNTPGVPLSTEFLPLGATSNRFLRSDDADFGQIGGIDASLIRRRATGKGFELRYLSLNPGEAVATFAGNPVTLVRDFGQIGQIGGLTHEQAFNISEIHEVRRDMSIQNAEFNLLRMGRQASTRRGREATFEYLFGFRYFKFDETLSYSAYGIRPNRFSGGDISRADYVADVENELYGAQFGGRSELSLTQRLGLLIGLKAGIFQNNFSGSQRASVTGLDGQQRIAQVLNDPNQGTPFDVSGEDQDYTLLGEIDLGLTYRVTNSIRMRGGYKAIFVDDVAFAENQGSSNFNDIAANSIPRANEDLVLHGGYFGLDFAF
jgi:hypothetical protein